VSTTEDRLRDAFRADAESIRPGTIRLAPRPAADPPARQRSRPAGKPARPRRGRRLGIPLAAAAAVSIIVAAAAAVSAIGPGSHADHPPAGPASGAVPPFFVAVEPGTVAGLSNSAALQVRSSATGRIVAQVRPPARNRYFQAVASLGGDRTFIAAAAAGTPLSRPDSSCGTWLYRFRLTAQGRPADVTLLRPRLPGNVTAIAGSADGNVVAYNLRLCRSFSVLAGRVTVLSLRTGHGTSWPYAGPTGPFSLSLSAHGRLLGMVTSADGGAVQPPLDADQDAVYVLPTRGPGGLLGQHDRRVAGPAPHWALTEALTPGGATSIALLPVPSETGATPQLPLSEYNTATGRLVRVLTMLPLRGGLSAGLTVTPDASGRYLLLFGLDGGFERISTRTGQLTVIPGTLRYEPLSGAW
jgi:hypothetical protein